MTQDSNNSHPSNILTEILSKICKLTSLGEECLVVFDLDSTLFDVSPRLKKILDDVAELPEIKQHNPEVYEKLIKAYTLRTDWGIKDALVRVGLDPSQGYPDLHEKIKNFWVKNFFSNHYVHYDLPYDGSRTFVQILHDIGCQIVYLTGRDTFRMEKGSVEVLKKWSFPLDKTAKLVMKPEKGMDDGLFKSDWFKDHKVKNCWFFENEPVNINVLHKNHPEVDIVYFESTHSRKEIVPDHLIKINSFQVNFEKLAKLNFSVFSPLAKICYDDIEKRLMQYHLLKFDFREIPKHLLSQFHQSTAKEKKLVVLLHGFLGTPAEMQDIASQLELKKYSTLNLLIPGFGKEYKLANMVDYIYWENWLNDIILSVHGNFEEIHLIGFSTGGALICRLVNSLQETPPAMVEALSKNKTTAIEVLRKIKSTVLISPYFFPNYRILKLLRPFLLKFIKVLNIQNLFYFTKYPDILVMLKEPSIYMQNIPIASADQIFKLGQVTFKKILLSQKSDIKNLTFLSKSDKVINIKQSKILAEKLFSTSKIQTFSKLKAHPHHLMRSSVSAVAQQVTDDTVQFIESL